MHPFLPILLLLISLADAQAETALTLPTPDGPRTAIVLPSPGSGPQPTIVVLHGATISAIRTMRSSGFAEAAAAHGFTSVFPEGIGRFWNDARRNGNSKADDVFYLGALARKLVKDGIAIPDRLYLAGISNGGMMALTMACRADMPFVGVGTVIANLPANLLGPCTPKPIHVVMINGTEDPVVPFAGGAVGFRGTRGEVLGARHTAELFAKSGGCTETSSRVLSERTNPDATGVTLVSWTNCSPGGSLRLYEIHGGGHQVPGERTFLRYWFGKGNDNISAATVILDAFTTN